MGCDIEERKEERRKVLAVAIDLDIVITIHVYLIPRVLYSSTAVRWCSVVRGRDVAELGVPLLRFILLLLCYTLPVRVQKGCRFEERAQSLFKADDAA
jgi:hypothetical protein